MPCPGYRKKPLNIEHMEQQGEDVTMDAEVPNDTEVAPPEKTPPPEDAVTLPEKTPPPQDVVQHVPPPSDANILDDELYAAGLVVADHSAGSNYARYVRPKVPQSVSGGVLGDTARGRDRLKRVVPHTRVCFGQATTP